MSHELLFDIMKTPTLTHSQRVLELAKAAESAFDPLKLSEDTRALMENGIVFDMFEGKAPYRPRYVVPDYGKFFRQGSSFLELAPPKDMFEAVGNLMCLYHHVPGTSGVPVYGGCLDELLDPFIGDARTDESLIRLLLTHIDRTIGDAFCHVNLSGRDNAAARLILRLTAEMKRPVPNMTLLYRDDTPDEYALEAIRTGLAASKPSFANHNVCEAGMPGYAVVSCYNVLPIGGTGMTLVRLNMHELPKLAKTRTELIERAIPRTVAACCELIEERRRFIAGECRFFENSFLCREGLITDDAEHNVGMLGFVGLAECVNSYFGAHMYGNNDDADAFGLAVIDAVQGEMNRHRLGNAKLALHAQVGVMEDASSSPGGRIPIGDEPDMARQMRHFASIHHACSAGCGELYAFDSTAKNNPEAVLDIIKGAFSIGTSYISFYTADSDLVRVTGYLVKRSDIERLRGGNAVMNASTVFGKGITDNLHLFDRKLHCGNV